MLVSNTKALTILLAILLLQQGCYSRNLLNPIQSLEKDMEKMFDNIQVPGKSLWLQYLLEICCIVSTFLNISNDDAKDSGLVGFRALKAPVMNFLRNEI